MLKFHVIARLGQNNKVYSFAAIGGDAQDLSYQGQESHVVIGDRNIIREYVTINRGCHGAALTQVGNDCLLMAVVHIAHDCIVGNQVIMANLVTLGGHTLVEDQAVIGGLAGTHQFVRIGRMAMVGGASAVLRDVPPYCLVQGNAPALVRGLNSVGLKRNGASPAAISGLKAAFRLMYRRGMTKSNALDEIAESAPASAEVSNFVDFIKAKSRCGICLGEPASTALLSDPKEPGQDISNIPGSQRFGSLGSG